MSSKTVIESSYDSDQTVIEGSPKTILEGASPTQKSDLTLTTFQEYTIIEQFPTSGSEADIYLVQKDKQKYVLKLYRFGIEPKREVVEKLKFLSENYPKDIIKIYAIEYDPSLKRWYEIQEYVAHGSLETLKMTKLSLDELKLILVEIARMLHTIHSQNIIHRDLKPDNLLIRHKEPLNLVMTDFGISSVLDSELSKRMTSKSGTKIYFAPESFSGVIGKEVDYWALGMILLELASGDNIFKELDENYIAYSISTKNVPIPKEIDSDFAYLLKGLLTRDPQHRWGHDEIVRWLKGDQDIALEYHSSEGEYEKPYVISGKKYYDLSELVALFATTPQMWQEGKAHLYRGYITKWLENNNDFDKSIKIDELKKSKDDDFALFKLIYTHNHDLDFIIGGKLINAKNLMLFMGKYLTDDCSDIQESIVHLALTGKILDYYQIFKSSKKDGSDALASPLNEAKTIVFKKIEDFEKILKSIIEYYKDNHIYAMERIKDIMQFLKIATKQEEYYFSYDILMAHESLLIKRTNFDYLNSHFTLPQDIIDMVESRRFRRKDLKYLRRLLAYDFDAHYLPVDFNQKLKEDFVYVVDNLEHLISKAQFDKQLTEMFLPEFFKEQIQNVTFTEYLEDISKLKSLESLEKRHYARLQKTYYMPTIDTHTQDFEAFASQVGLINDLIVEGLLIAKETLSTLSNYIPQEIQESIQKGEYDYPTAQRLFRLNNFEMEHYTLPDNFATQLQNNFTKVVDNLDASLPKELYERVFVPKRIDDLLLHSSFSNYLNIARLIHDTQMQRSDLEELQNDQAFLDAVGLKLDDINNLDEKDLKFIKKILDAKVDRVAYTHMIAIYDRVMESKSDKIKSYFKKLKLLNKEWSHTDAKIIEYIYNYRLNLRTTHEHVTYRKFSRYAIIMGKIALASFIFWFGARNIENSTLFYTVLALYIPASIFTFVRNEDIKLIQIYTKPFQIVLDNIERNEEFSRRVDWVVR
ncbi:MAG: protein kinase [Campylobacterota bacterium]|nr:protein kinase [Campylobacterota bacterium]